VVKRFATKVPPELADFKDERSWVDGDEGEMEVTSALKRYEHD
jgi:hypothetical protein